MTIDQSTTTFTAYEYAKVRMPKDKETLYADTYRNFGWQPDGYAESRPGSRTKEVQFKRDRSLRNRTEVADLQRKAEDALDTIVALERTRSSIASVIAYALGLIGTGFLGFSVFAFEAGVAMPSFIAGGIGIVLWVLAPVAFQAVRAWRSARVRPRIARQYDVVYSACEMASTRLRRVV